MPNTQYAKCGDLSLAYQVFGEGPVDIVFAGSFASHVEVMWALPEVKSFFDGLAKFARVLIFDKAGVGLSDPVAKVRSIEDRASELEAVMDAAGFERAAMMGISEGGPASIVFAAARPDRVTALVLMGTFPAVFVEGWEGLDETAAQIRARMIADVGEKYTPDEQQIRNIQAFGRAARDEWGTGKAARLLLPSVRSTQQLGMFERMSASPGMVRATAEALFRIDVRSILSAVAVPTIVIHATHDFAPIQLGRYLADFIPGATMLEIEGYDHAPWMNEPDRVIAEIEDFLTGSHSTAPSRRALRTVLYTDIVGSTERAAAMGDDRWHSLLEQYDEAVRSVVGRFNGQIIKAMGDGHLSTLDGPAQAIRCAQALQVAVEPLELQVKAGVHTGECELLGDDIGGLAVHIGARVIAHAGANEILVSSTVRDLVVGSGLGFEDRGVHELKGVPGMWQLLAVQRGNAAASSPEGKLVALPTPAARTAMRRSDRVMAVVARRAPGVLRGMSRLTPKRKPLVTPSSG